MMDGAKVFGVMADCRAIRAIHAAMDGTVCNRGLDQRWSCFGSKNMR